MDGNVRLIEPARDMSAPARKPLPELIMLPASFSAKGGVRIVHERNSIIDAATVVIGERGRHVARIAYDDDRAFGAAPAGEQRFALRRQRIGVMRLHETHRRRGI